MWFPERACLFHSLFIHDVCPEKVQLLLIWWEWFAWHGCSQAAKERGLECACVNNDIFTVLISGGGRCCWVSMCTIRDEAMSATEIKMWHEHFKDGRESVESDPHSGRPAEFFWWNIKSPRWLSPLYSPDLVPCDFWLFPKLKSLLKGKRFQTIDEIQKNTLGQLMTIPTKDFAECFEQWKRCWENCVRSQDAFFEGDWGVIVLCTMFLVSYIFFSKCLYFSYYMAGYLLDRPLMCVYIY